MDRCLEEVIGLEMDRSGASALAVALLMIVLFIFFLWFMWRLGIFDLEKASETVENTAQGVENGVR